MDQACMKCGYTRMANLVPVAECPRCGAIYAKVAAAVAQGKPVHRVRTSGFGAEAGLTLRQLAVAADGPESIPSAQDAAALAPLATVLPPHASLPRSAGPRRLFGVSPPPADKRFVDLMRSESLYPTFRAVVNVAFWLGVVLAVACVVGAAITIKGSETVRPLLIAIAAALGWMVLVLLAREAALMIADLSDATVRIAQAHEPAMAAPPAASEPS